MEPSFVPQNPHPHCYICGESDLEKLDKVCHHCGRAICSQHASTDLLFEAVLYNPEFTRLDLQGVTEYKVIHCKECARKFHWWRTPLGGLGRLLLLPSLYARLYIGKRQRPALPTLPNVTRILLEESLSGQATLDANGKYELPKAETAKGTLKIAFRFTEQDWRRVKRYCAKYGVAPWDETLAYHAGFALLQNTDNLFLDDPGNAQEQQNQTAQNDTAHVLREGTLAFIGRIGNQRFFTEQAPSQPNNWEPTCSYTIKRADGKRLPLPIQIIPIIKPDGGQQTLQLTIQLSPDNPISAYELIFLNSVTLQAPGELKTATWVGPSAEVNNPADPTTPSEAPISVTWRNLEGLKPNEPKALLIGFAEKLQPTMVLQGSITATFSGALSGVKGVKLFYPWGQARSPSRVQLQTKIEMKFVLHLAKVRFQTAHSTPCHFNRIGVVPDYRFINTLVERLSKEQYYVRRTVENPSQTPSTNGHLRRYLWDIAGRAYTGIHPIDFQLMITGEESHVGNRPNSLEVNITTKAVGAAEVIPAETEKLCENLRTLITGI